MLLCLEVVLVIIIYVALHNCSVATLFLRKPRSHKYKRDVQDWDSSGLSIQTLEIHFIEFLLHSPCPN